MVGGQDELVFDGASIYFDSKGNPILKGKDFSEDLLIKTLGQRLRNKPITIKRGTKNESLLHIFSALSLGLKDYVLKNGFNKVVIGISGGIDSALVAAIASKSLGPKNVLGIAMPTKFNSQLSLNLANDLSKNIGFRLKISEIQEIFDNNLKLLKRDVYGKTDFDITEENLQARIRANILMATSNKLPKTLVYDLAKFYNIHNPNQAIPLKIIQRDPSAELRMNQKDSDSLPPYKILDKILEFYIEDGIEAIKIASKLGIKKSLVLKIINKLNMSEFKRRQGPIGIKITSKAFGRDRRYPITNGFKEA